MEEGNVPQRPDGDQEEPLDGGSNPSRMPSARITTIVGGRPAGDTGAPGAFPAGIEQVLTLAALDDSFRAALREDREAAARARGIELTPAEMQLLKTMPAVVLEHAIDQVLVPSTSRRGFIKAASITAVAILAAGAGLVHFVSGSVQVSYGSRPDPVAEERLRVLRSLRSAGIRPGEDTTKGIRPDLPSEGRGPGDYWIRLADRPALLHVPDALLPGGFPVILVFHDRGKTVLDAVHPWRDCAATAGHLVVGVKWSGQAADVEQTAAVAGQMLDDLTSDYQLDLGEPIVAAGTGLGATIALQAALFVEKRFAAAVAVDGALPEGWEKRKPVDPENTAVYAVAGQGVPEGERLTAQMQALKQHGIRVQVEGLVGPSAERWSPASAWPWLIGLRPSVL